MKLVAVQGFHSLNPEQKDVLINSLVQLGIPFFTHPQQCVGYRSTENPVFSFPCEASSGRKSNHFVLRVGRTTNPYCDGILCSEYLDNVEVLYSVLAPFLEQTL